MALLSKEAADFLSVFDEQVEPKTSFKNFEDHLVKDMIALGFVVQKEDTFLELTEFGYFTLIDHYRSTMNEGVFKPNFFQQYPDEHFMNYQTQSGLPVKIEALGSGDGYDDAPLDTFAVGQVNNETHFWRDDGTHFSDKNYNLQRTSN